MDRLSAPFTLRMQLDVNSPQYQAWLKTPAGKRYLHEQKSLAKRGWVTENTPGLRPHVVMRGLSDG